jgi:hypothetical protein
LVAAALASFLVSLDALVVTTALPTIRRDVGALEADIGIADQDLALLHVRPMHRELAEAGEAVGDIRRPYSRPTTITIRPPYRAISKANSQFASTCLRSFR